MAVALRRNVDPNAIKRPKKGPLGEKRKCPGALEFGKFLLDPNTGMTEAKVTRVSAYPGGFAPEKPMLVETTYRVSENGKRVLVKERSARELAPNEAEEFVRSVEEDRERNPSAYVNPEEVVKTMRKLAKSLQEEEEKEGGFRFTVF